MKKTILNLATMLAFFVGVAVFATSCDKDKNNDDGESSTDKIGKVSSDMVAVEGGTFMMGDTWGDGGKDESPTHQVTLSSFSIGKHEVTQGLWWAVMGCWPSNAPSSTYGQGDNYPMYNVTYNDVQDFLTLLNQKTGKTYRLPTEAEWEYAARGGSQSEGYKYSGSDIIGNVAWYSVNSDNKIHEVGTKQANELGIYDMSGNVWEWCSDWYRSYNSGAQTNPTGPSIGSLRIIRGVSWIFTITDHFFSYYCRVSSRLCYLPNDRDINFGFRLACSSN